MRLMRHWYPNQRQFPTYSFQIAFHWYGFTIVVHWNKSMGVFAPVFFNTIPEFIKRRAVKNKGAERNDDQPWEFDNE